jgi:hypothetical protein
MSKRCILRLGKIVVHDGDLPLSSTYQDVSDLIDKADNKNGGPRRRYIVKYKGRELSATLAETLKGTKDETSAKPCLLECYCWDYGTGEIYVSPRLLLTEGTGLISHSYLVTRVHEDGSVAEFVGFDPSEALDPAPAIKELIVGVNVKPRWCDDPEIIATIFSSTDLVQ